MATIIGLIFSIYFWPTQNQEQYCYEAQWSNETVIINNRPQLSYEAQAKARACDLILKKYWNENY